MIDLFGLERQPKRIHDKREAAALVEVLKALNTHPAVSWAERMNSGAARIGARFVRFGFKGCPDVLGQLRDGLLLGVAVKAKAEELVRKSEVRKTVRKGQTVIETMQITVAATLKADIIIGHP